VSVPACLAELSAHAPQSGWSAKGELEALALAGRLEIREGNVHHHQLSAAIAAARVLAGFPDGLH
jgi:hypothetical protein